jgi:hypothetical protein
LLLVEWGVTRIELLPFGVFRAFRPIAISGDEPHYLMVVNSLLFDHDFELQDDYRRVANGGVEAGMRWRGYLLDHHTILVNPRTGARALWLNEFGDHLPSPIWKRQRQPQQFEASDRNFPASDDVYEVSAHPAAFPLLLAGMIWPFHPAKSDAERDVSLAIVFISWLTGVFTYLLAARTGAKMGLATVGLLMFASPWLAYTRSFFAEPAIGLSLVLALLALEAGRPTACGIAVGAAMAFKPTFVAVGLGIVSQLVRERRWEYAFRAGGALIGVGAATIAFNFWLAGVPMLSGARTLVPGSDWWSTRLVESLSVSRDLVPGVSGWPMRLSEWLILPRHGLLVFVPWVVFAFWDIGMEQIRFSRTRTGNVVVRFMFLPCSIYLAEMTFLGVLGHELGGGFCYGPRYWVPFLPWFALASARHFLGASWRARGIIAVTISIGALFAISGALEYPTMFAKPAYLALRRLGSMLGSP